MSARRTFAADAQSVASARRFARETLERWSAGELVDNVTLVVSELVTNAVVHTGTPVRLVLRLSGQDLRVEVEDRHPGRTVAMATSRPADKEEHGRGLLITMSVSASWGVEYTASTKRVWAVCRREVPAPAPTATGDGLRLVRDDGLSVAVVQVSPEGRVAGWRGDAAAMFGWAAADVKGRLLADLVDPVPVVPSAGWQGVATMLCKDGSLAPVFVSQVRDDAGQAVALLVPEGSRSLLEHPAAARPAKTVHSAPDPLGLRDDALLRLGVDEYLTLAVERVRDALSADATYLMLEREFDEEYEVVTASGLPETVRRVRLAPGAPGAPSVHGSHLPVIVRDLAELDVPLLAGTELGSLVVVPMIVEGKVIGALAAAWPRADGFSDEQAVLLQRFADSVALAADRARLQASERERRGWLSFIADSGDLLAGSLDQEMTMAITGQIVVPRIARWCGIHLSDERDNPVLCHVWHHDERQVEDLRTALEKIEPEELVGLDSPFLGYSVTSIPLVARGRQIGFLTIGRSRGQLMRSEFYLVAESIARRAALAIDNARTHGKLQAVGRALQESLLPTSIPTVPGLDVGVVYEPAGEDAAVGGDFYDLFPLGSGKWCFVVGDVCGTGAEAAAVTGLARHTIQALTRAGFPIAATLERLNTAILDEGPRARFLTLVCGTLQLKSGHVQLHMVNAGHPPPFLVERSGEVRELGTTQSLLGVVERVAYVDEAHELGRGDLLVAVTDGVLERREGERMLGDDGLAEELAHVNGLPAQAVAERIRRMVVDFTDAPQQDDMAIMAIRMEMGAAG